MEPNGYEAASRRPVAGCSGSWLAAVLGVLALAWAAVRPVPARAKHLLQYFDVACGGGLTPSMASGVSAGGVHDCVFRRGCSLQNRRTRVPAG